MECKVKLKPTDLDCKPGDIDIMLERHIQTLQKKIDEHLIKQLEFAEPKIKGEITKGKLRWRGIRLVNQEIHGTFKKEYYLTQRGKKIGESIII